MKPIQKPLVIISPYFSLIPPHLIHLFNFFLCLFSYKFCLNFVSNIWHTHTHHCIEITKEIADDGFPMMHCEPGTSSKITKITMPKMGMAQKMSSRMEMAQIKQEKEKANINEDKFNIRRTQKWQQQRLLPPFPTVEDDDPIDGNEVAAHWMRPRRRPGTFSHHQTPKFSLIGLGLLLLIATVHFGVANAQKQPNVSIKNMEFSENLKHSYIFGPLKKSSFLNWKNK